METAAIAAWTFVAECPIPDDVGPLLVEGEQPWAAYKTFRDSAIFTNKGVNIRKLDHLISHAVLNG